MKMLIMEALACQAKEFGLSPKDKEKSSKYFQQEGDMGSTHF